MLRSARKCLQFRIRRWSLRQLWSHQRRLTQWLSSLPLSLLFPRPPFHRTLTVTPREGLLVLFPGWLVHSVLPANATAETSVGAGVGAGGSESESESDSAGYEYRVSVSMNLKGEWQDTGNLVVDHVPFDVACVA